MADAIANLLEIMRDESASPRDRINAAVSASRVEKLQLPGEEPPESIAYLRAIISDIDVATNFRREAAAACAYFERRSKKAALTFEVADLTEQQRQWANIANACLRYQLSLSGDWPQNRNLLQQDAPTPPTNPEVTIAALLMPVTRARSASRKRRTVDDPGGTPILNSERERRDAIRPIAKLCAARQEGDAR
jgi:hypothetical protein